MKILHHTEGEDPRNCQLCLSHATERARAGQPAVDVIWQNDRTYNHWHYGMLNKAKEKLVGLHGMNKAIATRTKLDRLEAALRERDKN